MNADVTVRELMNREYVGVSESDDLVETVEVLLAEEADTAVVLRGQEPIGVVTERDILNVLVDDPALETATVADAMTDELPTVSPEEPLDKAADKMSAQSTRRLLVIELGELRGVITEHDLLTSRAGEPVQETAVTAATADQTAESARTTEQSDERYSDQSICEVCGSLASDLRSFNGQLVCPDCRDI